MNSLTNPYILKIIELNKELSQKQQRVFSLRNHLNDYKKSPVTTVPIGILSDEIFMLEDNCIQIERNILKISKFIGK